MATKFSEWLQGEIDKREMSQADLSRKSGVSRGGISDILAGRRDPGVKMAAKIARALKLPDAEVYRAAGLLPEDPAVDAGVEEIMYHVKDLNKDQRNAVLAFIETLNKLRKK